MSADIQTYEQALEKVNNFKWHHLHPMMADRAKMLALDLLEGFRLQQTTTAFAPFEGYRSPERQNELFNKTPPVTKVIGWRSAHQFGLAVDFVAWTTKGWSWDDNHDWKFLIDHAQEVGLGVPISWDAPHVEHPAWKQIQAIWRRALRA